MEITIRPLAVDDAYTSVKWRNDPEVFKYTGNTYGHEITLESELNWIKRVIANKDEYRCAILADRVYVGNIYLTDITEKEATYHIFIGDKNYWGKGVAKKSSYLILDHAFYKLNLESVILKVNIQNTTALNLYRRIGFKEKEYIKDSYFIRMSLERQDYINLNIPDVELLN